jgi:ABC-type nickel/cobalt efflux system permease component RcnA
MSELFNYCVGMAMSIGLILVVACCVAPVAWLFRATGRRRRKDTKMRKRQRIGTRETICMVLVVILLALMLANGTISATISSLFGK